MTVAEFINKVGFKVNKQDVDKVNNTMQDIKATASKLLGAIGIGFSLTAINSLVEEFGRVNDQVKNSTAALGDQVEIQQKIMQAAKDTRSAYSSTAGIVSKLVHENSELFGTIDEAVKFNNAATMLFKSAGKTNEDISALMEAINKSFAKGYVDSETISQLLERSPEAVELLNKKLGTTSDKLEEMASSRAMTVADLKAAFVDNADVIEQKFAGTQYRISDALVVIRSEWGLWLSQMDSTLGITSAIARGLTQFSNVAIGVMNKVRNAVQWLGDKLGGTDKLLKLLAISVGAFLVATKAGKIIDFLKKAGSLLGGIKLKTLAIVAVIILIALLIEDFINFMQGNDSLLGAMLEKAGIDADAVREKIQNAWQKIKEFLVTTWNGLKALCSSVWGGIKNFFAEHGEQIKSVLTTVWNAIKTVLVVVWNVIKAVATTVFGGLKKFFDKHGEQIKTAFTNIWTGIKNVLTFVWNAIKAVATIVFNKLKKFWDTWGETILTAFQQIWNIIQAVFGAAFDVLADLFAAFSALFAGDWEGFWENIQQYFSDLWNGILNILSTILTAIWEVAVSIFTTIWEGITTTVGNIKDSIVEGFTAAIEWIKGLPAQAVQWGKDIIDSIVEGITGAVGKVGEAVSGVADKIKSFLGFSEPEDGPLSDFHTYMPDMIDLMASGIKSGRSKIRDALGALSGDMSVMAKATIASPETARTAMGNSNVSKSVVQNVNINNRFEGDRAGQQKSAAAMNKASDDVTSKLARGLAYVR